MPTIPTIKVLAEYVGVSPSTVSIVLRGEASERKISQSTQDKIWEAVHELGYQPNISARRLRNRSSERTQIIAVFWASDFRAPMMVRFLRGLQSGILKSHEKCDIIIHPYKNDALFKEFSLKNINMFNAAIICNASQADMDFLEDTEFHIPIVLYNRKSKNFCTVTVDDTKLGSIPAEIFAARGHHRMAVLSSASVFSGMTVRTQSLLDAWAQKHLEVCAFIEQDNSMTGGYDAAKKILELPQLPDCLFCVSDAMALGALHAFWKAGIRIPEDMEIISVGNGDKEQEEYSCPSLSVVHLPMEKMAEACLQLLWDLSNNVIESPHSMELPIDYVQRESCGPFNHSPAKTDTL